MVFKIHSTLNNWRITDEIIKKISAEYGDNHELRIEVELTASQMLLASMTDYSSKNCKCAPENT